MNLKIFRLSARLLALVLATEAARAESATFEWANLFTSVDEEHRSIDGVADADGNVVIAYHSGLYTVDGQKDPGYYQSNAVVKVDATGNVLWTQQLLPQINKLATDFNGSIYVMGNLLRFNLTPFTPTNYFSIVGITPEGAGSAYVAKVSPAGAVDWVRLLGDSPAIVANGVAVDRDGNYHVAGFYTLGSARFGTNVLPATSPTKARNLFVVKYTSSGQVLWVRVGVGTSEGDYISNLAVDAAGNVIMVGVANAPRSFEGGHSTGVGSFLIKFDREGKFLWTLDAGGSIAADAGGNVFQAVANYQGSGFDIVLNKYGPDGDLRWSRSTWLAGDFGYMLRLGVDPEGNCALVGTFGASGSSGSIVPGEIVFGDVKLQTTALVDMFVAKYSSSGEVRWAIQSEGLEPLWIGDAPSRWSDTRPSFISISRAGTIFVGADLKGTVQFGGTILDGGVGGRLWDTPTAILVACVSDPDSNRPSLSLTQGSNGFQLRWPASFSGFVLESADTISGGSWNPVTTASVLGGDQNVVTVEVGSGSKFFRLKKP